MKPHDYLRAMGIDPWILRAPRTPRQVQVMVIGEKVTDLTQPAQALLQKILYAVALPEDDVCFVNADDAENILQQTIKQIKPKCILALGARAGQVLLKQSLPFETLRNQWFEYEGIPLRVSFHPTDLLKTTLNKRDAYRDWCAIVEALA
jgi:uracil-DNA glycosylase